MASPAELVRMVSSATGVPFPTIVDIDRWLVKGELRTKGGRGLNAAKMTPVDAARLLTAVLASAQANSAVEAVARYIQTRVDKRRSSSTLFGLLNLDDLAALPARHNFVDALAAVIASASAGSLAKLMIEKGGWMPDIEVLAFTRAVRGRIRIANLPNRLTASVEYIPAPSNTKRSRAGARSLSHVADTGDSTGDLEQSRRITERTILPVAALLAPQSRNDPR